MKRAQLLIRIGGLPQGVALTRSVAVECLGATRPHWGTLAESRWRWGSSLGSEEGNLGNMLSQGSAVITYAPRGQ
jgi:hypothetical protein